MGEKMTFKQFLSEKLVPTGQIFGGTVAHPLEKNFPTDYLNNQFVDVKSGKNLHQEPFFSDFTPEHTHTLFNYKTNSHQYNGILRAKVKPDVSDDFNDDIKRLDHITSHRIIRPLIGYRGYGFYGSQNRLNLDKFSRKGSVIHDRGYTGTSLSWRHALGFSDKTPKGMRRIAEIHMPIGTKGFYIEPYNDHGEKEFLLHRGTKFRVIGHSIRSENDHTPVHVVHMTVHSQEHHDGY